jgi:hypothetical protein
MCFSYLIFIHDLNILAILGKELFMFMSTGWIVSLNCGHQLAQVNPRGYTRIEFRRNNTDSEKPKMLEINLFQCHSLHHKLPPGLTWARIRASAATARRLTDWDMAHPRRERNESIFPLYGIVISTSSLELECLKRLYSIFLLYQRSRVTLNTDWH